MPLGRPKFFFAASLILFFLLIILSRLAYLQIFQGLQYRRFSEAYTLKEITIPAARGMIYDRRGHLLASTRPSFNLFLHLSRIKNPSVFFEQLSPLIEVSPETLKATLSTSLLKGLPHFKPLLLKSDLSKDQLCRLEMKRSLEKFEEDSSNDFSALELRVEPVRHYENGEVFAHVIGFLREVGKERLQELSQTFPGKYSEGDGIGVQGIERKFDLNLRGEEGHHEIIVDARGRQMREDFGLDRSLLNLPPVAGADLYLTLDYPLQQVAYDALGSQTGAVVVIQVETGDVLAMVSKPSFDPEKLGLNLSKDYWLKLNTDEGKLLLNRAIQAAYPPGSTFKIVTGLAALSDQKVQASEKVSCPGYHRVGGRRFGCWLSSGHGAVDFHRAITQSCDVFFYKMGERVGIDRIASYAKLLGFGEKTGIELDFERSGLIPTTSWKQSVKKQEWNPGETLSASIGQGYDLVTPLQNAVMMVRVASRGRQVLPHLVSRIEYSNGKVEQPIKPPPLPLLPLPTSEKTWTLLLDALKGVVEEAGGTAHRIALPQVGIGGKTGTAQVVGYDRYGRKARSRQTEDHAWFVAFAPTQNPEIALSVLVEHGGHGGAAAAPIAQAVIKKYFEIYHGSGKSP